MLRTKFVGLSFCAERRISEQVVPTTRKRKIQRCFALQARPGRVRPTGCARVHSSFLICICAHQLVSVAAIYMVLLRRLSIIAETNERFARAHRSTRAARPGTGRIPGDLRNLFGVASQSCCRSGLVIADCGYCSAGANGGEPSRWKTF